MASEIVVPHSSFRTSPGDVTIDVRDTDARPNGAGEPDARADDARSEPVEAKHAAELDDPGCVICGDEIAEAGACCSSRCAGEAQRQLRRNAARLRRLQRRDAVDLRHHLAERNGRLMSAILRWRPDAEEPSLG